MTPYEIGLMTDALEEHRIEQDKAIKRATSGSNDSNTMSNPSSGVDSEIIG